MWQSNPATKARNNLLILVIGLIGMLFFVVVSKHNMTPEAKAINDCAYDASQRYTGTRIGGHIPLAVLDAQLAKCQIEVKTKAVEKSE